MIKILLPMIYPSVIIVMTMEKYTGFTSQRMMVILFVTLRTRHLDPLRLWGVPSNY